MSENKNDSHGGTAAAAPPADLVSVQIDGEWHRVPKGTRMIEAIRMARGDGTTVPHYCYHPKLSAPGNCRMCLVEMGMPPRSAPGEEPERDADGHLPIQWMPRAAIACANTVADNMGIRTDSKLAQECQRGVMEFLLINHPLDCPICDQAGECRLQEFSVEYGAGFSRFRERKVKKPKRVDIGPRITLDDERCIMCSRCIRFCDEIADDDVLGFVDRGSHTVLTVHPGKRLANNYSLNTVDICPVGALTSDDFRFQMRVWFLRETRSICTQCGRGCNTVIGSRENRVYRQTPRENNDVNSTWMCDQGRLGFHFLESDARLTDPMVRLPDGTHDCVAWPEAIAAAAEAIRATEPGEVALIGSARMTNEEMFMFRRLAQTIGTDKVDIVPRTADGDDLLRSSDGNPNTLGARVVLGIEKPGAKLDAIRSGIEEGTIKAVVAWSENLAGAAGFAPELLEKIPALVSAHVLANRTAEKSAVVLAGSAYAEKRGSMINVTGRLQRLGKAIDPPGFAMDDWEILRDLGAAIGGGNGLYLLEDVFKAMAGEISEFSGLSLGKIGDLGIPLIETQETIPLLEREAERRVKGVIP